MKKRELMEIYKEGQRIQLSDDLPGEKNYKKGMKGTIKFIDDIGQIHTQFDNGGLLGLMHGEFTVIND